MISVDFDHVLELRVSDDGDRVRQCCAELQVQSNGSLSRQIHVIVFGEIRSQVIGIQRISAGVIGPVDVVSLVSIYLGRAAEQTRVRRNVLVRGKIQFQRF
jgi:hypothetical protein